MSIGIADPIAAVKVATSTGDALRTCYVTYASLLAVGVTATRNPARTETARIAPKAYLVSRRRASASRPACVLTPFRRYAPNTPLAVRSTHNTGCFGRRRATAEEQPESGKQPPHPDNSAKARYLTAAIAASFASCSVASAAAALRSVPALVLVCRTIQQPFCDVPRFG